MRWSSSLAVLLVGLAVAPTAQRDASGERIAVTVTQVLPEMADAWQYAVRDNAIPPQKKAGLAFRHTYATGPFGKLYTFVTITPIEEYAQYDRPGALARSLGADGLAKYNADVRPMLVSTHVTAMTLQRPLSIVSDTRTPAPFVMIETVHPLPGRGPEYHAIMAADYLPVYRKAGIRDYWFYTSSYGAVPTVMVVRPVSKLAELDQPNPLLEAMNHALGVEAAQQLHLRRDALLSSSGPIELHRFVPELSFGMPATNPTP